jgi:hypothetical protein
MRALAVMIAMAGTARADVNLLVSAPTTVAVSSTVDNAKIVPAHLVDGKLDTAWNSRSGDLVGAWIAVRVPKDAHVTSIKLTAGFVKNDKTGDLFAMNQRIKKVRVSREGKVVGEFALDPEVRTLQDIPMDADGGDFTIQVLQLQAGTKPDWREVAVSELEVWGTVPTPVASHPTVRVGSLDVDCAKLLFPSIKVNKLDDDDFVLAVDSIALGRGLVSCRVAHGPLNSKTPRFEVAAVRLGNRPAVIGRESFDTAVFRMPEEQSPLFQDSGNVVVEAFALTDSENAMLVHKIEQTDGPMTDDSGTESTLFRVTPTAMTKVLAFKSHKMRGEAADIDTCHVQIARNRKPLPDLDVVCERVEERYHGEGPPRTESTRKEHYRWNGTKYVAR